ncbi:MAG: hypothetical protein ACRDXC_02530, partial [Acidimicrobiales bacterium]
MTVAGKLLAELRTLGVTATVQDGRVRVCPASVIPAELLSLLRAHREELFVALQGRDTWQAEPPAVGGAWALRLVQDPRPDLAGDSETWGRLLVLAQGGGGDELLDVLRGLRCCGARLRATSGGWELYPLIDPTGRLSVWHDEAAWKKDRRSLDPHTGRLRILLGQL